MFELRLEDRQSDRVIVSVVLRPDDVPVDVEGVAVELYNRCCECVAPRVLLPVSGRLAHPIQIRVEVRATSAIPAGSTVVGTMWSKNDTLRATCPADLSTELGVHTLGQRCLRLGDGVPELRSVTEDERLRLAERFPWLTRCERAAQIETEPDEPIDTSDVVDDVTDELGLCDEDAAFLRDLLEEDF